LHLSPRLL